MAKDKTYDRHINIWINGKEVRNDVSSIRKEMYQLTNQQAKMTIGSEEYVEKGKEIKQLKGILKEHQESISATGSRWGFLGNSVSGGISKMTAAFKAFMANPIVFILAAIVGAVTALVKAFKSSDSGATEFAARFEQIKAILDVVRQRLISATEAIGHVFKGEWKEAAESMKEVFTGIGEQIKFATRAAYDYQQALDKTQDAENNYISKAAENRNRIAKLEYTAQDRSRSTEERKKALLEAIDIAMEEVTVDKDFKKQKLDNEINYLAGKAGLRAEDVLGFILMTDAEQQNADESLQTLRNNNEDKFAEIEKLYADWIDADTKFYEENKRNISRISGFEEEIINEIEETDKKAHESILKRREEREKAGVDEMKRLADEYKAGKDLQDQIDLKRRETEQQRRADREKEGVDEFKRLEDQYRTAEQLEQEHTDAKVRIAASATNLLAAVAGKHKALLKASLIADTAVAIAEIIIQNRKANAATMAWGALGGPIGMLFARATTMKNNVATGIEIAKVVAASMVGLAGLYEGGFTEKGPKYEPAGIVHKGEWVASQEMVNSPRTGPIIAALESTRVNGSYAQGGYADGGYASGSLSAGSSALLTPDLGRVLESNTKAINLLNGILSEINQNGVSTRFTYGTIDNIRRGMNKLSDLESDVTG